MKRFECPHCHELRIAHAKFRGDIVVVMQCPSCHELVVVFRNKIVGLNRELLESSNREERKKHLANVIAEFLEPELLNLNFDEMTLGIGLGANPNPEAEAEDAEDEAEEVAADPISDSEIRSFTQEELSKLDDSDYFKRHFS